MFNAATYGFHNDKPECHFIDSTYKILTSHFCFIVQWVGDQIFFAIFIHYSQIHHN